MKAQYLSVRAFAEMLAVDDKTIRREITRGRLRAVRAAGCVRISREEINRYLRKCRIVAGHQHEGPCA